MSLSREINEKLDELNFFKAEMRKMESEIKEDAEFTNVMTGNKTDKAGAMRVVEAMVEQIKDDINKLTNDGKNVKEIFTNKFYVNDMMQDKEIVRQKDLDNAPNT